MYVPKTFEEPQLYKLYDLMRTNPFAALVIQGENGLNVNHVPFAVCPNPPPYGMLRCHVARANPVWRELPTCKECVVIFQGPHAYISPSWYPSKKEHGKVVPTWNYAVVHAYGRPETIEDAGWLINLLDELTEKHESSQSAPWKVSDAPREFIDKMLRSIVGIEIPISRICGKWKQSQNRPPADRYGVIAGLEGQDDSASKAVAQLVRKTLD